MANTSHAIRPEPPKEGCAHSSPNMLLRSDSVAGKPRQDAYFDEESDDDDPGPRLANMDNKLRVDSDAYFDQESDDDDLGPRLVNMENKSQVDAVLTASPDTSLTWCSTPSPLRGARQMGATPSPCVSPQPECATPSRLRNLSRASSNETSPLQVCMMSRCSPPPCCPSARTLQENPHACSVLRASAHRARQGPLIWQTCIYGPTCAQSTTRSNRRPPQHTAAVPALRYQRQGRGSLIQ